MSTSRWSAISQVDVAGHRIAYRERGAGPPLVLLHGWPLDSRQWRRQLEGLSDEFRVVAWDAPGAGRSSDPPETFRLADWADCLAEFIEVLNLAPAHVAGLSFGGGLALELFQRHPDVVRSLILLSAYAGWGGSLSAEEVHERLELTRRNTTLPPEQWAPALIDTLLPDDANPELADELAAMLVDFHPQATRTSLEAFAEADLRDVLAEVDVPTLLLYGELDVRSPRTVWEAIHQGIAGSRLVCWQSPRPAPGGRASDLQVRRSDGFGGASDLQVRRSGVRGDASDLQVRRSGVRGDASGMQVR